MRPIASTSADGSGGVRMPGTREVRSSPTVVGEPNDRPPSVERIAAISASPSYGITRLPFGWTSGCQPDPLAAATTVGELHVKPPLVDAESASTPLLPGCVVHTA